MNVYFQIGVLTASLFLGMWLENEFHLAAQTVTAYRQLGVAQKGEANIIKDTQTLNKDIQHDKTDPCLGAPVPANLDKQLR